MRFVINVGGVKREIHGSFSICGTKQDFETLLSFLSQGLQNDFSYKWIDIHPQVIKTRANESPYDWWQESK